VNLSLYYIIVIGVGYPVATVE